MTLLNIFYFMNFFVRPTVKKWRQKCAKKRQKCAPPTPPDPPKPIFLVGGVSSNLPMPKKPITLGFVPRSPTLTPPPGCPEGGGAPRPPGQNLKKRKNTRVFFLCHKKIP